MNPARRADWAWLHIARRDLRAAAGSPLLWLVLAAWLLIVHGLFVLTLNRVHGGTSTAPLFISALYWGSVTLSLLFAPALTMNAWASERAQGTWQLLLTAPVRSADLVLGKILAAWGLQLLLLLATLAMPATLAVISEVAPAHLAACYLGLLLIAAFMASLGTWIGLLVEGPVATFLMTFAAIAVLWLIGVTGSDGPLGPLALALGFGQNSRSFFFGRIGLAEVLWFASATALLALLAIGVIEVRRRSGSPRWWRRVGIAGGPTLATAFLAVVAVAAAHRANLGIDLSADHRFSLSPALEHRLAAEREPIELVGVWSDADDGVLEPIGDAAARIVQVAPHGSWRRLDPERHLPQLTGFEASHGKPRPPSLWVVRKGQAQRIALDINSRRTIQRDVAGALIALSDPSPPVLRFSKGHGELFPGGGNGDGCDQLLDAARSTGFRTEALDDAAPAPPPGDVLALLGPTAPVGAPGLARLEAHLNDGGGVLVLADDTMPGDLGRWLGRHGLLVAGMDATRILDPQAKALPLQHLVSLKNYRAGQEQGLSNHNLLLAGPDMLNPRNDAITGPLVYGNLQLLSPFTAPCDLLSQQALERLGTKVENATWLLATLPGDSWPRFRGEPLEAPAGLDHNDPRALAWALSFPPAANAAAAGHGGRLVVWGSRQAGSDGVLAQGDFANARLLAGACRWLAGREPPPDIPDAEFRAFQIVISDSSLKMLSFALALLVPLLCLGGAILAWIDQRR